MVRPLLVLCGITAAVWAALDADVRRAFSKTDPEARVRLLVGARGAVAGTDRKQRNRAAAAVSKGLSGEASPAVRMAAVDLLLALRTERSLDRLVVGALDKSDLVRRHVHDLVRDHADPKLHEAIVRALREDASWRLRAAMVDLLLAGARESAKAPLLDALGDRHPAVAARAGEVLERLTGKAFGTFREKWQEYFERAAEKVKRSKTGETVTVADPHRKVEKLKTGPILGLIPTLYTVPIRAKRVVFVVDMSSSMAKGVRSSHFVELKRALFSLASDVRFNVLCFDQRLFFFAKAKALEPATIPVKADVERWINELPAGESTDVNGSVVAGLAMLKEALERNPDQSAELFILTDGRETAKTTPLGAVERHFEKLPERRCRVHVIALGRMGTPALRTLAEKSGGKFVEAPLR